MSYEVELQRQDQGAQLSRALYYGARLLSAQLKESSYFDDLKPVKVIFLTRFELFPDPHPARTLYPTPYLIQRETQGIPLIERSPFIEPFDLSHISHHHQKKAFERKEKELEEMRELLSVTLVELTKDLSELTEPAQRCLKALSPQYELSDPFTSQSQEEAMNSAHKKPYVPNPDDYENTADYEEQLVELPEGWPDDPWVRAFYSRLQRFAGDPQKVGEYDRAERNLRDHASLLRFVETTGRETGYEEGREAGHAAGHAEGHAEGHATGQAKARAELLRVTIPSLLNAGKSPQEVAELLQLSDEELAEHLPS